MEITNLVEPQLHRSLSECQPLAPPERLPLDRAATAPTTLERFRRAKVSRAVGKHPSFDESLVAEAGDTGLWHLRLQPAHEKGAEQRAFIADALRNHHVCALFTETDINVIVDTMEYFAFNEGESLVEQGEIGQFCFIVDSGSLEVRTEGRGVVNYMGRGEVFGGAALLFECPQPQTVHAAEPCGIWGVGRKDFRGICTVNARNRHAESCRLLESIKLFRGLSVEQKARVGELALFTEFYEARTQVIRQGEDIVAIYFVKTGELSVLVDARLDAASNLVGGTKVDVLKAGDAFGKGAALYNRRKSKVTIIAETDCELVCIGIEQMKAVLGNDLAAALESSFLLKTLAESAFFTQFAHAQKLHFVNAMDIRDYKPNEDIDEDGMDFAILIDGEVVCVDATGNTDVILKPGQLRETDMFKTAAGIRKRRSHRSSSVSGLSMSSRSLSLSDLGGRSFLSGDTGARIASLTQQRLSTALEEVGINCRTEEFVDHARRMLLARKVPLFQHLSAEQIDTIAESFIHVRLAKDATICEQGCADAKDLWVVALGQVELLADGVQARVISQGGHFGMRAMLLGGPRRVTGRVLSEGAELWQLEAEAFDQIVTGNVREELTRRAKLQDVKVKSLKTLRQVRVIGSGSFGSVHLVESRETGMRYALKRIRKELHARVEGVVARECALLGQMDHPLILYLVNSFETKSSMYILSELLEGGELLTAINDMNRPLNRKEAQFYVGSLVLVLEFLCNRRVVFRDLKPENVMLDAQGYIKLIDFGTAKKLGAEGLTFTMIGSFHFMAPEVTLGHGYGCEVDVWSLGILFFELVCGHLPFGADLVDPTGVEICKIVQLTNLAFPAWYADALSKNLMREMLRKEPQRRLGSGTNGHGEIMQHDFFKREGLGPGCELFSKLLARELPPPYVPRGERFLDPEVGSDDKAALSDEEIGT